MPCAWEYPLSPTQSLTIQDEFVAIFLVFMALATPTLACFCTTIFDPVCWNGKTYPNKCTALCDNAIEDQIRGGECPPGS